MAALTVGDVTTIVLRGLVPLKNYQNPLFPMNNPFCYYGPL